MTAKEIANVLGGRKSGGSWTARCPAHGHRTPSLSIRDADGGKVLVSCHAGCAQERVIAVLRAHGLWPKKNPVCFCVQPYSYFPAPQTLDKLAERERMSPVEFTSRLWDCGMAELEADGVRVWPAGKPQGDAP